MKIYKKHLKNLVFDLGNVLVAVEHRNFTEYMGWDYEQFRACFNSSFFKDFERGLHDEESYFRELAKYVPLREADIPRYRENIHLAFPLWQEILDMLPHLRRTYRLYLFSNTNCLDFPAISRFIRFEDFFDGVYTSYKEGHSKPKPEAYESIMRLFGLEANSILYFDDRPENTAGGISSGWQSLLVDSRENLVKILEQLCESSSNILIESIRLP